MKIIELFDVGTAYRELRKKILDAHPWGPLVDFQYQENLPEDWRAQTDAVYLIHPDHAAKMYSEGQEEPQEVVEATAADSFLLQEGRWLPRIFMRSALKTVIVQKAPGLSNQGVAYVTGCGAWASFAAVTAIQMGFRRICVVCSESEQRQAMIEKLKRHYFQIDFIGIADNELTLQPNNGTLLFNTQPHAENEMLLEDLTYLNFLKAEGLVVDFDLISAEQNLLREAVHIGEKVIHPIELFCTRDGFLLASLLREKDAGVKENLESFLAAWRKWLAGSHLFQDSQTKV